MAGALGDLVIALHADIAKFESDMGRAARVSEREWDKVASAATVAAKALAGAAVLAGAAALKMGHDFIEAAANLDDLAEKTGASVEQLSKLSQQAFISGQSMETVELGLVRLAKALHGSDDEAKGAGKALQALGLSADELKNKDTAEGLRIVAVELSKYQDGAGKTALALDLFGKSGAQLLPILKDMATEGELSARVTAKQAAEAEELGKSWRRLQNDMMAAKNALALSLVPTMQMLINVFNDTNKATGSFAMSLNAMANSQFFGNDSAERIRNITKELEKLNRQQEIYNGFLAKPLLGMRESNLQAALAAAKAFQRAEALALPGGDTPGEKQKFGLPGSVQTLNYQAARAARSGAANDDLEKQMREQIAFQGRMLKADLGAQQYFRSEMDKLDQEGMRSAQEQMDFSGKMLKADLQAQLYYVHEIEKLNKEAADSAKGASDSTAEFWRAAFESMQRSASDLFFNAMQGNFKDFGSRFKATIDRMVADWLAAQALMRAQSFIGSRLGGANDFGVFSGLVGSVGNFFGGTQAPAPVTELPFVGSFDKGTDYVPRTGLAMVHEGEWIGRDRGGPGRGGMAININVTGPVDRRSADAIAVATGRAVSRALDRNT